MWSPAYTTVRLNMALREPIYILNLFTRVLWNYPHQQQVETYPYLRITLLEKYQREFFLLASKEAEHDTTWP